MSFRPVKAGRHLGAKLIKLRCRFEYEGQVLVEIGQVGNEVGVVDGIGATFIKLQGHGFTHGVAIASVMR